MPTTSYFGSTLEYFKFWEAAVAFFCNLHILSFASAKILWKFSFFFEIQYSSSLNYLIVPLAFHEGFIF